MFLAAIATGWMTVQQCSGDIKAPQNCAQVLNQHGQTLFQRSCGTHVFKSDDGTIIRAIISCGK